MDFRASDRLDHILDSITQIEAMLEGKTFEDVRSDRVLRAAYERFIEIISEASRHVPDAMKAAAPEIPWRRVADIGNHLRHGYDDLSFEYLWNLFAGGSLKELRTAAERLTGKDGEASKTP
ncbi:MAG: HepT-like ribonuclease domain-containing protein [Rhizobiaceae bacterium]